MGIEIDLLKNYPKTKRNVNDRGKSKSEEDRNLARKFGKEFFDGSRDHGYGGFTYNPRFWQPVVPTFVDHFKITNKDKILDVGCAKGFMLYDFLELTPGISIQGLDISEYAIENALPSIKPFLEVGNAISLPYDDNAFDIVISITTLHNLEIDECAKAIQEVERVSNRGSFITLDAYRNEEEKKRMEAWNLTAKTMMHVDEWKLFFKKINYTGDYFWFIP
jgi:SAM-dependent methyltransferase